MGCAGAVPGTAGIGEFPIAALLGGANMAVGVLVHRVAVAAGGFCTPALGQLAVESLANPTVSVMAPAPALRLTQATPRRRRGTWNARIPSASMRSVGRR
jgi:hypothetical protein